MSSKAPTSEETDITDSFISLNTSKIHCKNQFWTKKKPPSQDCHATMLFVFSLFFFQTHDSNQSNHAVYSTHVIWLAESARLHSRAQHDVIFRVIREVLEIFLFLKVPRPVFLSMLTKKRKSMADWLERASLQVASRLDHSRQKRTVFLSQNCCTLMIARGAWTSLRTVPAI